MKLLISTVLAMTSVMGLSAQTILSEDFETGNTGDKPTPVTVGQGWQVVNGYKGDVSRYNWYNYYAKAESDNGPTINGDCCAAVEAPFTYDASKPDGYGPREEILLSPELDLNDTYQLGFTFRVSPMNSSEKSRYDLQVRVVTDNNLAGAETIFSIQNEKMLRESGISVFPIPDWNKYSAQVDLSDFKGEKVKLAFVYKMMGETANVLWLDDISVSKYTPATTPVASVTTDRYDYGSLYIGEKKYTDVITLTNKGTDGLKITSVDLPAGVALSIDPATVNLDRYKSVSFQLSYTASLQSPASANAVLHTTGGDVTIALKASKQFVPAGSTLVTFEGYFPPAGWNNNGWMAIGKALEGDQSAYCDGNFSASSLRSPRLDLTDGGDVTFTYFNYFDDDEYALPEYNIVLQLSDDGGDNWITMWATPDENLNEVLDVTVNLPAKGDNCYLRWYYPRVETDDEGAFAHSSFYLDRVLLPNVYGADGVPMDTKVLTPANNATDIYPRDIKLSWTPAQFAKGYKLYVGSNTAGNDLIDGLDLGDVLTYTLPSAAYETTYRWKVVAYNDKGSCQTASTWKFTTQPDASVSTYPYEENFEGNTLPAGWNNVPSTNYNRTWSINSYFPYKNDGKEYGALCTIWLQNGDSNAVMSPEFSLPANRPASISFVWGDTHPRDLVVDPMGTVQKQNVEPNNGKSQQFFEILVDNEWITLSTLSENPFDDDHKYWINEKIDLSAYAGKKVMFRWRHVSYSSNDNGGSLTHIMVTENEGQRALFNKSEYAAGKVNYNKAVNSGDVFSIINDGTEALTVKSATFAGDNFETSIAAGDHIAIGSTLPFNITFKALDSNGSVNDVLTVEYEGGYKMTLPVRGIALPEGTYYYSFEPNDLDYDWEQDFSQIDVDKAANYDISSYWVHYSAGGMKGAFSCESDSKEDGMYGMMKPVSGMYALVAASPQSTSADNWLISKKMKATAASQFEFYARNWDCTTSVLPESNHHVEVLVSEAGNTDTKDFVSVMRDTEIPLVDEGEWNHYAVDLSSYAGKNIYVALRHTTVGPSNLAFFDDLRFSNFDTDLTGVEEIGAADGIAADADVTVYSLDGVTVAAGKAGDVLPALAKGLYIVRTDSAAFRIMK